jgi:hypothetical protein
MVILLGGGGGNTDQICRQLGALILKNCLRSKRTNLERLASSLEKFTITFSSRVAILILRYNRNKILFMNTFL